MNATLEPPQKELLPPLLRVGDVARLLSVSNQSVRNLITSGDLLGSRVNPGRAARKHFRITRESLLKFYKSRFGHSLLDALAHSFRP